MKSKRILVYALAASIVLLCVSVYAQVSRPYRNGTMWTITFVRVKPGMDTAYLNYLANQWKKEQEALKAENVILSYKVLATEGHGTTDFNLMLMTEYKDMASMEANEQKAEAISQKVVGNDQTVMQGYKERSEIREIVADRLAREIVLEPRK